MSRLDPEQRRRSRHFVWTMVALLIGFGLAAVVYLLWHLTWLAVALVAVSVPLRWVAMLVADAYPPALPRRRG
jgi:hypothetical protein